jgi:peptidoglycan/LPS O-acetylase OafA/YrhL
LDFFNPITFLIMCLPYGFGALLCRELIVRWNKGGVSLILLGIAYGFYEEGIVARSFFNPNWGEENPAFLQFGYRYGVHWTYAMAETHFHVFISITAGILLAEMLFFERRHESWMGRGGILACVAGLLAWWPILYSLNPYNPPVEYTILVLVTIAGLILLARVIPARVFPAVERKIHPLLIFLIGAVFMTSYFVLVFMSPEAGWPPLKTVILLLIAIDIITLALVVITSGNGESWDDRHRFAWVVGVLFFFIGFGLFLADLEQFTGRILVGISAIFALWWIGRWIMKRNLLQAENPD